MKNTYLSPKDQPKLLFQENILLIFLHFTIIFGCFTFFAMILLEKGLHVGWKHSAYIDYNIFILLSVIFGFMSYLLMSIFYYQRDLIRHLVYSTFKYYMPIDAYMVDLCTISLSLPFIITWFQIFFILTEVIRHVILKKWLFDNK